VSSHFNAQDEERVSVCLNPLDGKALATLYSICVKEIEENVS